jgi:H+/Cl- antiporter ClcA
VSSQIELSDIALKMKTAGPSAAKKGSVFRRNRCLEWMGLGVLNTVPWWFIFVALGLIAGMGYIALEFHHQLNIVAQEDIWKHQMDYFSANYFCYNGEN